MPRGVTCGETGMMASITAANSSPKIEEALIAPTPCYPPWRFQSYSTARAVWCVSMCGPLSADVKEYAFIERPTIPGRRRRRRCCRQHSCRQSSANAAAADTQAIETGKGVEGNGALRPCASRDAHVSEGSIASGLPQSTDIVRPARVVRFVPQAHLMSAPVAVLTIG
jgi:hypothetical protein